LVLEQIIYIPPIFRSLGKSIDLLIFEKQPLKNKSCKYHFTKEVS
jgi:hypothetical protein